MKRIFDFLVSLVGLIILSPLLLIVLLLIWLYDFHSPLYRPVRAGKNNKSFRMTKFRSMIHNADKVGPSSTSGSDRRITPIGRFIRKFKLDEFVQLWDVLVGTMSLVGPRPQVKQHVDECYTSEEMKLLLLKPGITDFASIVFSDEGDILKYCEDADIGYNQLIRPWKSRLGIFYIENRTFLIDIQLIYITVIAISNKKSALVKLSSILKAAGADQDLVEIASRKAELSPTPPPGASTIVTNPNGTIG